jgi:hypothetical protein
MFANNLVDRTTEVQVNEIRLHPVDYRLRGVSQTIRFGSKQLDPDRSLLRQELKHLPGAPIPVQDTICRHKFGHENVRALFLAQPSEYGICHARHGRKINGLLVVEPGQHTTGLIYGRR